MNEILVFSSPWCASCPTLKTRIKNISKKYEDLAQFKYINVDEEPEYSMGFNIKGVPTVVIVKDGAVVNSWTGLRSESEISTAIQSYLLRSL